MELQFNIDGVEYQVPQFITVGCFEKSIVWNLEDPKNLKPFVATIVGCPISHLSRLEEEVLAFITGVCIQRLQVNGSELETQIGDYRLRDFESFTFGNFIDLDSYMSHSVGQNLGDIVKILYGVDTDEVYDWDVAKVWSAVQAVAKWRQGVYTQYEEFFGLADVDKSDDVEDVEANIPLMWYEAIMALAGSEFMKIHQVVERPYRECLNYLTWKKAQVQKEKLQNLKRKNDLQRSFR